MILKKLTLAHEKQNTGSFCTVVEADYNLVIFLFLDW